MRVEQKICCFWLPWTQVKSWKYDLSIWIRTYINPIKNRRLKTPERENKLLSKIKTFSKHNLIKLFLAPPLSAARKKMYEESFPVIQHLVYFGLKELWKWQLLKNNFSHIMLRDFCLPWQETVRLLYYVIQWSYQKKA